MESAIATSKRELIKLKNGYFRIELTGTAAAGGGNARTDWTIEGATYKFYLPPLNEMGFSDHFNQALIRIRMAEWGNTESLAFNEIPVSADGSGVFVGSRLNLHTNIPTRNQLLLHHEGSFFDGTELRMSNLQTPLHFKTGRDFMFSATALDGITANDIDGTTEIVEVGNTNQLAVDAGQTNGAGAGTEAAVALAAGAAGDSKFQVKRSKNTWCVDNSATSIFDDGILCANPFGKELRFQLRTGYANTVVGLGAENGDTAVQNICMLRVELEIQLLPNP